MKTETKSQAANEEPKFPIDIMVTSFGNWALGYGWVTLTLGTAKTTGLALYARHRVKDPVRRVVANIKDAMCFFEKHRIPARAAGKLLAKAMEEGDFGDICKNDPRIAQATKGAAQ